MSIIKKALMHGLAIAAIILIPVGATALAVVPEHPEKVVPPPHEQEVNAAALGPYFRGGPYYGYSSPYYGYGYNPYYGYYHSYRPYYYYPYYYYPYRPYYSAYWW